MLGGSVYIAFIRLVVSMAGTILLFSLLSESRFDRKKTAICYGCFTAALTALACVWYMADWDSFVRMVAFTMYVCFAVFAVIMSRDSVYMVIYKLALVFYLMAAFVIGGLEISINFFGRNVWADIIARMLMVLFFAFLLNKYVKQSIKEFGDYVENEADHFSVAAMIICILFGIGYILNPTLNKETTPMTDLSDCNKSVFDRNASASDISVLSAYWKGKGV